LIHDFLIFISIYPSSAHQAVSKSIFCDVLCGL
jgi:hypothetical protein